MEKTITEMCEMLELPEEIRPEIEAYEKEISYDGCEELLHELCSRETWDEARRKVKEKLCTDERGIAMLTVMLHCLCTVTYGEYRKRGIPEEIFLDTQKCFSRFVREHKDSFGVFGFDRDFWTVRQLGLVLFRIRELEYEFDRHEGEPVISIHIPSDAVMTPEKCRESFEAADAFFRAFYPDKAGLRFFCESWLLSPALVELLGPASNILKFRQQFEIVAWDRDSKGYEMWVFGRTGLPVEELPENSSLQRNMKRYLQSGKKVGEATGVLKRSQRSENE